MCTWFKHDSLAHKDKKLQRLMHDHGYTGYGMYFAILEWMTYDKDHYLDNDVHFVCRLLGERGKKPEDIVSDILYKYGLFVFTEDEREFTSERLQRSLPDTARGSERKAETEELSEEDSETLDEETSTKPKYTLSPEALEQRKNARRKTKSNEIPNEIGTKLNEIKRNSENEKTKSNEIPNEIETKSNENGGDIRGEEEREENKELRDKEEESVGGSRGTKRTAFVPPSLQDVKERCEAMGYKHVSAERFYDYYESIGWLVGGKAKMKKWENALANWEAREKATPERKPPTTRPTGLLNQGISRNDPRLAHLSKPPTAKPQANE